MDPRMYDSIETCGKTPHTIATPMTKEIITGTARSSVWVNQTSRHVNQMGRYGSTPGDNTIAVRPPRADSPVMIGGISISLACGISGGFYILNK